MGAPPLHLPRSHLFLTAVLCCTCDASLLDAGPCQTGPLLCLGTPQCLFPLYPDAEEKCISENGGPGGVGLGPRSHIFKDALDLRDLFG